MNVYIDIDGVLAHDSLRNNGMLKSIEVQPRYKLDINITSI